MGTKIPLGVALLVAAVCLGNLPGICWAQAADNTSINKRDNSPKARTADQQAETQQDRKLTQKIRRAIVADKSLSTYAHNVKIITVDGMVTLKGPVRSEEEKRTVEEKAAEIAGKGNIKSEIGIAAKKTTRK
jgi:hyperosmotically inducible periplasmic protein